MLRSVENVQVQRDEFSTFEMPKDTMTLQKDYFRSEVELKVLKMNDAAFAAARFAAVGLRIEASEYYGMALEIAESLKEKLEILAIDYKRSAAWQGLERLTEHYRTQLFIHQGNHELEALVRDGVDRHIMQNK